MQKTNVAALFITTLLLAACGPSVIPPIINPVEPPIQVPVAMKVSLGIYDLQLLGTTSLPLAAGASLRVELVGATSVNFEGTPASRFVTSRVRVTNLGTTTINHLILLPVSTTAVGNSPSATVGTTPFKNLIYSDGTDASGRAADLILGQASVEDQYPVTVRPDANASLFVQDIDTSDISAQAPVGLNVSSVQPQGWRLATALAPGESALMSLGSSIRTGNPGTRMPAAYAMSVVAVDDPKPQSSPFQVKLDLSKPLQGTEYGFPGWRPNGEALYITPAFGDLRMIALTKVTADGTAIFNLPEKTTMKPFSSPLKVRLPNDCVFKTDDNISTSAASIATVGFTLAEDFTIFRGLDLLIDLPSAGGASRSTLAYLDQDVQGTLDATCASGGPSTNPALHYVATYSAKAGWNLSTSSFSTGAAGSEFITTVKALTPDQVWTLRPSGMGGAQPPRY